MTRVHMLARVNTNERLDEAADKRHRHRRCVLWPLRFHSAEHHV